MKDSLITQFFIAGLVYSDYQDAKLKRGQRLSLIKEPGNLYDRNAIRIYAGKVFIGFVPADMTYQIHQFAGKVTKAVIQTYAPTNVTHRMVLVNVYGTPAVQSNKIC